MISGMTALISLPDDKLPFTITDNASASFAGGNGTISNPYQISNVTQLQNIDDNLTANYMLINDIDASDTKNWNSGKGFDPIGNYNKKFIGFFNGNGHNISNLYIHRKSDHHLGLFAHISHQGIVANLSLTDIDFSGQSSVGGIGSRLTNNSVIDNCHVTGEIRVSGGNLGGIVGYSRGHIINSISNCMIYATGSQVGGLIGEARGSSIIFNCTSNGLVSSGGGNCGGLVGLNTGSIYSSTTASKVSSHWYKVGGLVGSHSKDAEVTVGGIIQDCHSESEVYSGTAEAGGLVGTNYAVINNCSSNGIVNGKNNVGGLIGRNYGDISNSYSEGKVTGINSVGGFIGKAF
ncbi:MAG: hypothetical protein KAH57_11450, partial [Thermoplasmata archaeon]|nr:hypothetical protein [Thermoplasmata archaeon]